MTKTTCYDLSCGDKKIREWAVESGVDYMEYLSNERTIHSEGFEIKTWYDENAGSALSAWGAFIKGVGTCNRSSREEAVKAVIAKTKTR